MPDSNRCRWQTVHFEQEAAREFTCGRVTRHIARDITVEHLTCRIGVFTDLHLERNVPDVMQTKWHQRTFNYAINTKGDNRVLIRCPLREFLNRGTYRWPDKGEQHAENDSCQTGNNRHKTLTGKEAQIFWQLNAVEAIKHVCGDGTGDNTAQYPCVGEVFSLDLRRRQMQHQRGNYRHGFHHDAIGNNRCQRRNAVIIGKAQRHTNSENQRHVGEHRSTRFCHHMRNHCR